jgi:hypothetical protein
MSVPRSKLGKLKTFKKKNEIIIKTRNFDKITNDINKIHDITKLNFRGFRITSKDIVYDISDFIVYANPKKNFIHLKYKNIIKSDDIHDFYIFDKEGIILNDEKKIKSLTETMANTTNEVIMKLDLIYPNKVEQVDQINQINQIENVETNIESNINSDVKQIAELKNEFNPMNELNNIFVRLNQIKSVLNQLTILASLKDELKDLYAKSTVSEEKSYLDKTNIEDYKIKLDKIIDDNLNLKDKIIEFYPDFKNNIDQFEKLVTDNFDSKHEDKEKPRNKNKDERRILTAYSDKFNLQKLAYDYVEFKRENALFMIPEPDIYEIKTIDGYNHFIIFGLMNLKSRIVSQKYPFRQAKKLLHDYDKIYDKIMKNTIQHDQCDPGKDDPEKEEIDNLDDILIN